MENRGRSPGRLTGAIAMLPALDLGLNERNGRAGDARSNRQLGGAGDASKESVGVTAPGGEPRTRLLKRHDATRGRRGIAGQDLNENGAADVRGRLAEM